LSPLSLITWRTQHLKVFNVIRATGGKWPTMIDIELCAISPTLPALTTAGEHLEN